MVDDDPLTVEDILAARPSLRQRADEAWRGAKQEREDELEHTYGELEDELDAFLRSLGLDAAEMHDLAYKRGSFNRSTPEVTTVVDKIHLRIRPRKDEAVIEVRQRNSSTWKRVTDLVTLGEILSQ